ncbi:MAG: hypothetical protein E5X89_15430 [Mesorhizobium sp.]|nr:hypothetical protein [Mesorhizobium sp.]TIO11153.1 MAG: hypothetical protein E5X88_01225 [Mesorhizobium sp.]TIO33603.1 MAG: hypothetical protein E5X89_15430 [Mesorhizobium sp.]TIP14784.1 MAG: hypothetical protein E5X73_01990 [Mesorhizobium sp.]
MSPDLLSTTAGLWLAVVASGIYHGVNPGMGWPLAVSAALMERRAYALPVALMALAFGHLVAMTVVLLPFALMTALVDWQTEIRVGAGLIVVALGVWLLFNRRHPRFLARVPPSRLALWSFLVAVAHGAGLMLVPIYLGLCGVVETDAGHRAATALIARTAALSIGVAAVHTGAMITAGGALAFVVYRWLGLRFLSKSWFDLDVIWALSLVLVGAIGVFSAL